MTRGANPASRGNTKSPTHETAPLELGMRFALWMSARKYKHADWTDVAATWGCSRTTAYRLLATFRNVITGLPT